jgi:hypothetical protein
MDRNDPSIARVEDWALFEHVATRAVHLVGTKDRVPFRSSPIKFTAMDEGLVQTQSGKIYAMGQPSLTMARWSLASLNESYAVEPLPLEAFLARVRIKNGRHTAPVQGVNGGPVAGLRQPVQPNGPGAGIAGIIRNAMQGRAP